MQAFDSKQSVIISCQLAHFILTTPIDVVRPVVIGDGFVIMK